LFCESTGRSREKYSGSASFSGHPNNAAEGRKNIMAAKQIVNLAGSETWPRQIEGQSVKNIMSGGNVKTNADAGYPDFF
jgi:hypothetical protein